MLNVYEDALICPAIAAHEAFSVELIEYLSHDDFVAHRADLQAYEP